MAAKLYDGSDASVPGRPLPEPTDILCAYVGAADLAGQPDTPHIWTRAEWDKYLTAHRDLRVLPIYVHDFAGDPKADSDNAIDAIVDLGWKEGIDRLLVLDMETRVDPAYVRAFDHYVASAGFRLMLYGSLVFVLQNPAPLGGYWAASLTRRRPSVLPSFPGVRGQQWRFDFEGFDRSVFDRFVYDNCGRGLRRDVA